MSEITKNIVIDSIEILPETGSIQIRQRTDIVEGNEIISSQNHRWVLTPGQDISDQEPIVKKVVDLFWSPKVIENYKRFREQESKKLDEPNQNIDLEQKLRQIQGK